MTTQPATSSRVNALCPTHQVRFELKNNSVVSCNAASHILGTGYPESERPWEFCPSCRTVWPFQGRSGAARCLFCDTEVLHRRLCSRCSVIALSTKDGGVPVGCPGCLTEDGQTREHLCVEVGTFWTSRSECPFCEETLIPSTEAVAAEAAPVTARAPLPDPTTERRKSTIKIQKVSRDQSGPHTPVVAATLPDPSPPRNPNRIKLMVSAAAAAALLTILYLVLSPKSFAEKVDAALSEKRYFAPQGESVYDIFTEEAQKRPGSEELRAAAAKIRAVLEPPARAEVDRFYRDSVTDLHWDEIERYFAFLSALAPEARDLQVRHAYAEGQRKLNKDRDHRGALDSYLRAVKLDPTFALAFNGLAKVYVQDSSPVRNEAMAIYYYRRAAEVDPNFTWPLKNLGEYHIRRGEWDDAESYMVRALKTSPERASILMALGKIKYNQSRYRDARDYYTRALARANAPKDLLHINSALEQIRLKLNG